MDKKEELTVRKFMLKKFPTNEYIDCPIPKHHWETIQEYANEYASQKKEKEAVEFGIFLKTFMRSPTISEDNWFNMAGEIFTTEELYELYKMTNYESDILNLSQEKDAICFAEWVAVNPLVIISSAPKWHYDNGNYYEEITIGQLYEIYLKEKTK